MISLCSQSRTKDAKSYRILGNTLKYIYKHGYKNNFYSKINS